MKTIVKAWAFAALCMLFAGCVRENMDIAGHFIRFGARTEMSRITRTSYSGISEYDGLTSSYVERIDWENNDRIRIMSNEVSSPEEKWFDYDLTLSSNDAKFSFATADPHGAEHGLAWGTGDHIFYACYPSPSTTSAGVQAGIDFQLVSEGAAIMTCVIPADQSYSATRTGATESYYGNMNLAYMLAGSKAAEGASEVTLSFTPIVTTFYVMVVNDTGAPMTLRRVALSSKGSALSGTYKATMYEVNDLGSHHYRNYQIAYQYLRANGNYADFIDRSDANATIYADFNGMTLAANSSVTVALYALPHDVTEMTLSVVSDETGTVSLPLKETVAGELSWITFTREHKHNISNVKVPLVEFDITVTDASGNTVSEVEYGKTGVAGDPQTFYVTSTKTIGNATYAAPWKAQLKVADTGDEETDWVDMDASNRPTWLANYPLTDGDLLPLPAHSGTDAGRGEVRRNVAEQPVISHVDRLKSAKILKSGAPSNVPLYPTAEEAQTYASYYVDNSSAANAVDLSYYDFVNRKMESHQYTANTYVISSPGWYKFPCVYGNALENGATAEGSYTGHLLRLNHLDRFKKMNDFDIANWGPWLEMHGTVNYHRYTELVWEKYTTWDSQNEVTVTSGANHHQSPAITFGTQVEVIKNVGYENNAYDISNPYVIFYVDPDNIRPGNAVIATKENSLLVEDKITWSWQIWITDQDLTPVEINNGSANYNIMPVNLGWVDDQEGQFYPEVSDIIRFVNISDGVERCHTGAVSIEQPELEEISTTGWQTYYQWGRKDPFTAYPSVSVTGDHALYQTILNPDTMFWEESTYDGHHYYDWTSANYDNLWDSQCLTYGEPGTQLPNHKTVYDPSPRRYCVPPDNTFNGFSSDGTNGLYHNDTFYGYFFNTVGGGTTFFPASGYANYENDIVSLTDNNREGYYWTYHASANLQYRISYALHLAGGVDYYVHPVDQTVHHHRARGYSIRPVIFDESLVQTVDDGADVVTFNFSEMWGTTAPQNNLRNYSTTNSQDSDIVLTFLNGRNTTTLNNKAMVYEYADGQGSVLLYDSYNDGTTIQHFNGFTISTTNPNKHIVQIELTFIQEGESTISTDKLSYTGGIWIDRDDTPAAVDYTQTPHVWSGGESSVTFQTGVTGDTPWKLIEIAVDYYTTN